MGITISGELKATPIPIRFGIDIGINIDVNKKLWAVIIRTTMIRLFMDFDYAFLLLKTFLYLLFVGFPDQLQQFFHLALNKLQIRGKMKRNKGYSIQLLTGSHMGCFRPKIAFKNPILAAMLIKQK